MADLFGIGDVTGLTETQYGQGSAETQLSTGDLRRRYNFGPRVSEFVISQDPFFRLASKMSRKPVDEVEFKFTERRPSWHKRYAYVTDHGSTSSVGTANATVTAADIAQGDVYYFQMETDYKSAGNITNVFGQTSGAFDVGASGTEPAFFMEGQTVRIPFNNNAAASTAANSLAVDDSIVVRVDEVSSPASPSESVLLKVTVVKSLDTSTNNELAGWGLTGSSDQDISQYTTTEDLRIYDQLERARCYVVGSAFAHGSGYPETWKDQPFSTGHGRTEIWKTSLAMDNSSRATVLKYEPSEWGRVWKEKLIEHKWDIENSLWFHAQYADGTTYYTQGALDYCLNKGNIFTLTQSSYTQDDFLDDLSNYLDPRYNNGMATFFFCDTLTYNWLHKLSGYFRNNLEISANFRGDLSSMGKKSYYGVGANVISTPYGSMNVVRDVHLDGTQVAIAAINMKYMKWRPLVGNGINRDTAIYVGVQTLENSGVDRRVDLIQTEGGAEFQMPECHAVWKRA
jgi:hypothetical protein|tara:strand:- start:833 stop:2368 length:1536 start_codon:yes stop_codon:yes gene_type:complete